MHELNKMECIFLEEGKSCTVNLPQQVAPSAWKIDAETLKDYCVNKEFGICPRYRAYMEYIEKSSKSK